MLALQLIGLVFGGTFGCSSCSRCRWLELGFEAAGGLWFAVALGVGGDVRFGYAELKWLLCLLTVE